MKKNVENFIDFYKQQDVGRRRIIRDEFLEKSGMTYPAWYSKLRRNVFSKLELITLGDICGERFVD
jgi:hypothetical protein